jgi:hypothetical protein
VATQLEAALYCVRALARAIDRDIRQVGVFFIFQFWSLCSRQLMTRIHPISPRGATNRRRSLRVPWRSRRNCLVRARSLSFCVGVVAAAVVGALRRLRFVAFVFQSLSFL